LRQLRLLRFAGSWLQRREDRSGSVLDDFQAPGQECRVAGRPEILALGLCATCYTLKRQDEEYFGGLRETVLERDGYRCRGCGAAGREKRSIIVHHRVPGVSKLELMISLCPGCHAKVERTRVVLAEMNPLLLELGREQHPDGQEQIMLAFSAREPAVRRFRSRPTILKMKTRECDQDPSQAGMPGHPVSRTVIVTALKYMKDKLATLMTNREIDAMLSANQD
jgi:hypothetical protein